MQSSQRYELTTTRTRPSSATFVCQQKRSQSPKTQAEYRMTSSKRPVPLALALVVGFCTATLSESSFGMDLFEIQVYRDDINAPGHFGLELHANYTISGRQQAAYPGEQPPNHVARLTLEPALGITEFFELSAYLQNMMNDDGRYRFAGVKLRGKFVLPERYTHRFFLGLNIEFGRLPHAAEQEEWSNEFRPFAGWYNGHWLFDVNPIVGYALSGADKFKPEFEPAGKLGFNTQYGFMLGAEYYSGLGLLANPSPLREQEHLLFATFDLAEPAESGIEQPWELNLGIGKALTSATPQQWILKAIVGRSF